MDDTSFIYYNNPKERSDAASLKETDLEAQKNHACCIK